MTDILFNSEHLVSDIDIHAGVSTSHKYVSPGVYRKYGLDTQV